MKRYGLRDDQFARIEMLLPGRPGTVGRNSGGGNRLFVEAVIWKFRSGAPWRDVPERFGAWKNIHTRFSRWAMCGRLRVVKGISHVAALVVAAMCSAYWCGTRDRWP